MRFLSIAPGIPTRVSSKNLAGLFNAVSVGIPGVLPESLAEFVLELLQQIFFSLDCKFNQIFSLDFLLKLVFEDFPGFLQVFSQRVLPGSLLEILTAFARNCSTVFVGLLLLMIFRDYFKWLLLGFLRDFCKSSTKDISSREFSDISHVASCGISLINSQSFFLNWPNIIFQDYSQFFHVLRFSEMSVFFSRFFQKVLLGFR